MQPAHLEMKITLPALLIQATRSKKQKQIQFSVAQRHKTSIFSQNTAWL